MDHVHPRNDQFPEEVYKNLAHRVPLRLVDLGQLFDRTFFELVEIIFRLKIYLTYIRGTSTRPPSSFREGTATRLASAMGNRYGGQPTAQRIGTAVQYAGNV